MKPLSEEERKRRVEHRDTLMNIRAILSMKPGVDFLKYLLKYYDPIFLPPEGLEGSILHEGLGQRRAFIQLYNLFAEADPQTTARILAEVTKERNDELIRQDFEARQEDGQPASGG